MAVRINCKPRKSKTSWPQTGTEPMAFWLALRRSKPLSHREPTPKPPRSTSISSHCRQRCRCLTLQLQRSKGRDGCQCQIFMWHLSTRRTACFWDQIPLAFHEQKERKDRKKQRRVKTRRRMTEHQLSMIARVTLTKQWVRLRWELKPHMLVKVWSLSSSVA